MKPSVLIVIPTYNHFDYAAEAIASAFLASTHLDPHVLVVDDASPAYPGDITSSEDVNSLLALVPLDRQAEVRDKFDVMRFGVNGGLTRSWNYGLDYAKRYNHNYCCVTNSDVVFTTGWDFGVMEALRNYALVGPVTNAPGTSPEQYVGKYSVVYRREHPKENLTAIASELSAAQDARTKEVTLNGFCMIAKTKTWWENAFDAEHVFRPRNDFNSKGEPNPTPLMTLNEYELQSRWHQKGLKSAAVLSSYVFHYRAVTRGDREKRGDWVRKEGA